MQKIFKKLEKTFKSSIKSQKNLQPMKIKIQKPSWEEDLNPEKGDNSRKSSTEEEEFQKIFNEGRKIPEK
jgi:chromatin remodeling complex protein RSC6